MGDAWEVRRRWVTRLGRETAGRRVRRRFRSTVRRTADAPGDGCISDLGGSLVGFVLFLVLAVVLLFVVIPLVVVVVDLLLLLLLLLVGVAARVLFRRPWAVDAFGPDGQHLRWQVVGWRASRQRADEVAASLAAGVVPPGAELLHLLEVRRDVP